MLGTGGAIKQAFDLLDLDNAVIINGDTFVKMDYAKFYQTMQNEKLGLSLKYVEKSLFERDLPQKFSFEKDILEKVITTMKPKFFKADDYFIDIGLPESYSQACEELEREIYCVK